MWNKEGAVEFRRPSWQLHDCTNGLCEVQKQQRKHLQTTVTHRGYR